MTPELCTTSLIYDSNHHLLAWIDPLGFRYSYVYDPGDGLSSSVRESVQPLGQRTTYLSYNTLPGGRGQPQDTWRQVLDRGRLPDVGTNDAHAQDGR